MNITESQSLAVRKHCIPMLRDLSVRSITDLTPHKMTWAELNAAESRIKATCRNILDKTESASDDDLASLDKASDGLMRAYDELVHEKNVRTEEGSREPRKNVQSRAAIAKRPEYDPASSDGSHFEERVAEADVALKPEQRFSSWAKARSNNAEQYRELSLGKYLRSMVVGGKTDIERRALSEGSDSAGGFTTPDVLSAELIDLMRASSTVVQAGARTVPLTSDKNTVAKVLADPVPAWRAEAGNVAESDTTFGAVIMEPKSLAVRCKISQELMQDSLNLERELPRIMAAAMAVEADRVALLGSGTGNEPEGVANVTGIGTFAQNSIHAGYGNLSKARTAILTANSGPVSAYIMHPREEGWLVDQRDGNGQPLMAPTRIEEIPKLTSTSIPVDGGAGSDETTIFAGNWSRLLLGIRQEIRVELFRTLNYVQTLEYDMIAHMRMDVAVTHPGAFYTLTGVGRAA